MVPAENTANIKESKVKVDPWQVQSQQRHHQMNPVFTARPNFSGSCGTLIGKTFSGNRPKNFKLTLDNITIYFEATYIQDMEIKLKAHRDSVIFKPKDPDPGASKSANYIWKIKCKKYIICRENLKQGLKRLFPLLLGQCNDAMN